MCGRLKDIENRSSGVWRGSQIARRKHIEERSTHHLVAAVVHVQRHGDDVDGLCEAPRALGRARALAQRAGRQGGDVACSADNGGGSSVLLGDGVSKRWWCFTTMLLTRARQRDLMWYDVM